MDDPTNLVSANFVAPHPRATPPPGDAALGRPAPKDETAPQVVIGGLRDNQRLAATVLREIEAAVQATTPMWDASTKSFVDRPDYKTRLAACQLYLAHTVGLPVQRSENVNLNATASASAEIAWTPAIIEAVERQIAKAKAGKTLNSS